MKVYVAHPYGRRHGLRSWELERNAYAPIAIAIKLIKKGHNPFVPNLWHFIHKFWEETWNNSPDEDCWFGLVSAWIEDCDALLVGAIPEWDKELKTSGVAREIKITEQLGLPIYWKVEDIPDDK